MSFLGSVIIFQETFASTEEGAKREEKGGKFELTLIDVESRRQR